MSEYLGQKTTSTMSSPQGLQVAKLATSPVGQTIMEALECVNAAHNRLDLLEDRILGGQPRGADVPTPPNSLTDAAMRLRTAVITLNDRLDKLSGAL